MQRGGWSFAKDRFAALLILLFAVVAVSQPARAEIPLVQMVPGDPVLGLGSFDLASFGYRKDEFFLSGTAGAYKLSGPAGPDGNWEAVAADTAPYATRIVVVRPNDAGKFNGTVIVEWLNVSGGVDAAPDWNAAHREILRGGYAWVGVSAQKVGVQGGQSLTGIDMSLKKVNPQRYGSLSHPGDRYSFDIYSQVGELLRAPEAGGVLGALEPQRIIAAGESQSAVYLTTYVNAVDPVAKVYDGFLIHSRFGAGVAIDAESLFTGRTGPARLRANLRVPVLTVQTETDILDGNLLGFHVARQPDTDRLRIWEVAGTSHADNYTFSVGQMDSGLVPLEKLAAGYKPMTATLGGKFDKPINFAPQHHYVVQAALWHLDQWLRSGKAPPKAQPLQLTGKPVRFAKDGHGNALGGIRTPWVDVPTALLSGTGNSGNPLAFLVGIGQPFDQAKLDRLYPGGKQDYLRRFKTSLETAITKGFILPSDREEILGLAPLMYPGNR